MLDRQASCLDTHNGSIWSAEAPSNLALIKYMGKLEVKGKNVPSNSSLSITLPHLRSRVEALQIIEPKNGQLSSEGKPEEDQWTPWVGDFFGEKLEATENLWQPIELSKHGKDRFLAHWKLLKEKLNIKGIFKLQSANGFPSDCGLASSASSFAALSRLAQVISEAQNNNKLNIAEIYNLSRQGSGSSCRSFFEPWALWENEKVSQVNLPSLYHQVILVDVAAKKVSSSEAHKRIKSSWLAEGREVRSQKRLEFFQHELLCGSWKRAYEIAWSEFWDMHSLFETSEPSFGYMVPETIKALNIVRDFWIKEGNGPIVTMDAGANIHLLYKNENQDLAAEIAKKLQPLKVWSPSQELGV